MNNINLLTNQTSINRIQNTSRSVYHIELNNNLYLIYVSSKNNILTVTVNFNSYQFFINDYKTHLLQVLLQEFNTAPVKDIKDIALYLKIQITNNVYC